MTRKKSASRPAVRKSSAGTARKGASRAAAAVRKPARGTVRVPEAPPRPRPKSPFGKRDLEEFRAALLALRNNRIGDKESREKEALKAAGQDVSVDHMADFGSDNYEQEFTLGLLEQDIETLRDINDALMRIRDGHYGLCEECDRPVKKARLKVLPYARLCVDCKSKEE